jgi:alkylated DNA repair dioxygenase AlkB
MELFDNLTDKTQNRLPKDGIVLYYGPLLPPASANHYLDRLLAAIAWRNDEAVIFGKKTITKRKVAWYGDRPFEYTYSGTVKQALPWTKDLLELKTFVEKETGETYNACLLNLYHNGEEGVGWHSDGEPDLKKNGAIASLSLGVARKFVFKHKQSREKVELLLEHGSLLVMKGKTQTYWLHTLPTTKRITQIRISLTFRTIC